MNLSAPAHSDKKLIASTQVHRGPVTGVCGIPGSPLIITSAYDSGVGCFDITSGDSEILGYHAHLANSITVSDTGTLAASCSSDYTIIIWNLLTWEKAITLLGHGDDVEAFQFINDDIGVSASRDHRILVWNLNTGAIIRVLLGHDKDVLALAHHDGLLYSSGDDKTLRVWDLESGTLLNTWGPFESEADTCAISPEFRRAVLGCDDGVIRIFDTHTGELIKAINAHTSGIKKVAICSSGSTNSGDIVSAAYDQKILIWDSESLEKKCVLPYCPIVWERSICWSPSGNEIYAGTFDGTVKVWNVEHQTVVKDLGVSSGNACFNDVCTINNTQLATVSDDGLVRLASLSPSSGDWHGIERPGDERVLMNAISSSHQSDIVLGGAHNHFLHAFQCNESQLQHCWRLNLGEGPINTIRTAKYNLQETAYIGCYSGMILKVTLAGERIGEIDLHEGAVKSLRMHPTMPLGLSCGADGILMLWDTDGKRIRQFHGHHAIINDVDISPNGKYALSVGRDFSLKVFDLQDATLINSISIGSRSLKSLCCWNDTWTFVGDYWGRLHRIDIKTGESQHLNLASNGLSAMAKLGEHLVVVSYDGVVYLVCPKTLTTINTLRAMKQKPCGHD